MSHPRSQTTQSLQSACRRSFRADARETALVKWYPVLLEAVANTRVFA